MAPEFSPNIAVLDLHFEGPKLVGSLNYYEKSAGKIAIRWLIEEPPQGYKAIGGGAAYIKVAGEDIIEPPVSEKQRLVPISEDSQRFQWSEGAREEGKPPPMLVLILPKGYTAGDLLPRPIGTDLFTNAAGDQRLVLFWLEKDKKMERICAEWTLSPGQDDLTADWIKINSQYLSLRASDESSSTSLVETQSIGDQGNRLRLLKTLDRRFTIEGLQEICFLLNEDYQNIPGGTKNMKLLGLIGYFEDLDRIAGLIEVLEELRPNSPWRDLFIKAGYTL